MKKILSSFGLNILPLFFVTRAFAQSTEEVDIGAGVSDFFGFKCILEFVFRIVDVAMILAGIALLAYLVWGGVEWLISGGDKTKIQSAQSRITNAIIGVAIIATAFAVWKIVLYFFGIDISTVCTENPVGGTGI